jgi:hypothetical protein
MVMQFTNCDNVAQTEMCHSQPGRTSRGECGGAEVTPGIDHRVWREPGCLVLARKPHAYLNVLNVENGRRGPSCMSHPPQHLFGSFRGWVPRLISQPPHRYILRVPHSRSSRF